MLTLGYSGGGGGAKVALTRNGDGTVTARIGGASTGTLAYSIDGASWVVVEDATLPYTVPGVGAGNAVEVIGSAVASVDSLLADYAANGLEPYTVFDAAGATYAANAAYVAVDDLITYSGGTSMTFGSDGNLTSTSSKRLPEYAMTAPLYLIGDSFLGGGTLADGIAAEADPYSVLTYVNDSVGGSTLADQASRFASAGPEDYHKTLIIMDGGLTDATTAAAITAIDDMVGRLQHDRWVYVESAPFFANDSDGRAAKAAAIAAHVGAAHYVPTLAEAQALSDGSPEDIARVADGQWPLSLTVSAGDLHPNAAGYEFLAGEIHAKLVAESYIGSNLRVNAGLFTEPAGQNILPYTAFDSITPTGWIVTTQSGTYGTELTARFGQPALRFSATSGRNQWRQGVSLTASTVYTLSARVSVTNPGVSNWRVLAVMNLSDYALLSGTGYPSEVDEDGYVSIVFQTGSDVAGDVRIGVGIDTTVTQDVTISEVQLEVGSKRTSYQPTTTAAAARTAQTAEVMAASLPGSASALSGALRQIIAYVDGDSATQETILDWSADASNSIKVVLDTSSTKTGTLTLTMTNGGSSASVSAPIEITAGVGRRLNLAWRATSSAINIAIDGQAATEVATAIGVPDLSAAAAKIAPGASAMTSRALFWGADIADAGIEEASGPL